MQNAPMTSGSEGEEPVVSQQGPQADIAKTGPPKGTLGWTEASASTRLRDCSTVEIAGDLLARLKAGRGLGEGSREVMTGVHLQAELGLQLDVHENRFGRRRLANNFWNSYRRFHDVMPRIAGATVLDIGCGGVNPLGLSLAYLALGAERAFGIDLDDVHDIPIATRGLAQTAAMMLLDPKSIFADYPITRAEILENLSCLDLAKLAAGNPQGLDRNRIWFLQESVHDLSLADDSVDIVASNAFLEHVPELDVALRELARVTRPGGIHAHVIDLRDHRHYADPSVHPLAFLQEPIGPEIVHGCNRERAGGFRRRFLEAGMEVLVLDPQCPIEVDDAIRSTFVEPFRSMSAAELGILCLVTAARKGPGSDREA